MKINPLHLIGFLVLSMIGLSSCGDGSIIDESPEERDMVLPQTIVKATLFGQVIDESGTPITDALIDYQNGATPVQVYTNDQGYFEIKDVTNQGEAAYLRITYPGKFEAFRRFSLVENRVNYTEVTMVERRIVGRVDADQGGLVSIDVGASLQLPAGGIVTTDGAAYKGQVDVTMSWVDPSAEDLSSRMIGDLSGQDLDGNLRSLSSMGMLQVELLAEDGSLLNLSEGQLATLTFPIPASLMSKATPTIPLWSYDEDAGIWIEEGEANLQGDTYVGEVSHFSSWNVDFMGDPISITGVVNWEIQKTETEKISVGGSFLQIYVCSELFGRKGGWLCEDGSFRFYRFPKDEKFQLKILDDCNNVIFEETYGPYAEDEDLGTISVVPGPASFISISGNALNCDGVPVTNGHVVVRHDEAENLYPIDDDGTFNIGFYSCAAEELRIEIIDYSAVQGSGELVYPVEVGYLVLEDVLVCQGLENFFNINIEERNIDHTFTSMNVAWDATIYLDEDELSADSSLYIISSGIAIAEDPVITGHSIAFGVVLHKDYLNDDGFDKSNVEINGMFYIDQANALDCEYDIGDLPSAEISISFSELNLSPGGIVAGSFSGGADCVLTTDLSSTENIVSGSFRLRFQ